MPAKSEAQRRYLNSKFGHAWVVRHGFNNKGKLPGHVGKKTKKKRSSQRRGKTKVITYGKWH